ncbi:MAG: DUF169 domain-containing protein [bacterium]|nr:MAG: DUF169 domain-containing protein [bacterium]
MDLTLKERFLDGWVNYFGSADLPIVFFFSDDDRYEEHVKITEGFTCMIGQLKEVRDGQTAAFTGDSIGCRGGVRYSGFPSKPDPNLAYFLSCGVPGQFEGLRLKRTPELVEGLAGSASIVPAEGTYLVAKRFDALDPEDAPRVVAWFAGPDVIAALFHLAAFDTSDRNCVISPQTAGCGSIINYPLAEGDRDDPRGVLGMFDISARPYVRADVLTFAVPLKLFERMVEGMDESFLTAEAWQGIKRRIEKPNT